MQLPPLRLAWQRSNPGDCCMSHTGLLAVTAATRRASAAGQHAALRPALGMSQLDASACNDLTAGQICHAGLQQCLLGGMQDTRHMCLVSQGAASGQVPLEVRFWGCPSLCEGRRTIRLRASTRRLIPPFTPSPLACSGLST